MVDNELKVTADRDPSNTFVSGKFRNSKQPSNEPKAVKIGHIPHGDQSLLLWC